MTRKELISSPEYWTTNAQIDLYNCADDFMKKHDMNRKQLADSLHVSKSYVTQLLGGGFDHRLSKFMELAIAFGFVPKIDFIPIDEYVLQDAAEWTSWGNTTYNGGMEWNYATLYSDKDYSTLGTYKGKEAA